MSDKKWPRMITESEIDELKEQAEWAKQDNELYSGEPDRILRLIAGYEKMREALEFYADKNNWNDRWIEEDEDRPGDIYDVVAREDVDIERDDEGYFLTYGGKRARQTLAEVGGEKK